MFFTNISFINLLYLIVYLLLLTQISTDHLQAYLGYCFLPQLTNPDKLFELQ